MHLGRMSLPTILSGDHNIPEPFETNGIGYCAWVGEVCGQEVAELQHSQKLMEEVNAAVVSKTPCGQFIHTSALSL